MLTTTKVLSICSTNLRNLQHEKSKAKAILLPGEADFPAILQLIIVMMKLVIICSREIHYTNSFGLRSLAHTILFLNVNLFCNMGLPSWKAHDATK